MTTQDRARPTERQLELLVFMADYHTAHRRWPSQREIARAMGVQSSNMSGYLRQLVDKRLVRKTRAKHRNAAITTDGWAAIRSEAPPQQQSS